MGKKWLRKYLPNEYKETIHDINYQELYDNGFRFILFDIDNTIADYNTHYPTDDKIALIELVKTIGFTLILISNNKGKRVSDFAKAFNIKGYNSLRKPFKHRIKKIIERENIDSLKTAWIGDQAVTDIVCANKLNIGYKVLVKPIDSSTDHWYTRVNRRIEKTIMTRIKKKLKTEYFEMGLDKRYGN